MTEEQQIAAENVAAAYMRTTASGIALSSLERVDGSRGAQTSDSRRFRAWLAACRAAGLDPSGTLYVLAFGYSFATVDRSTRRRRHTTRDEMRKCLALWT